MSIFINGVVTEEMIQAERNALASAEAIRISVGVTHLDTQITAVAADGSERPIRHIANLEVYLPASAVTLTWLKLED